MLSSDRIIGRPALARNLTTNSEKDVLRITGTLPDLHSTVYLVRGGTDITIIRTTGTPAGQIKADCAGVDPGAGGILNYDIVCTGTGEIIGQVLTAKTAELKGVTSWNGQSLRLQCNRNVYNTLDIIVVMDKGLLHSVPNFYEATVNYI